MDAAPASASLSPVAVVGAGAVGAALARRAHARGLPVETVLSPTAAHADRLARAVGAAVAAGPADVAAPVVFVCVPDAALGEVDAALAAAGLWAGRLVAHTSGAVPAAALTALAAAGADVLAFHPAQSFAPDTPPEAFDGTVVALEGAAPAVARGRALAAALGLAAVVLPAETKARYHLALSVASNFTVTLVALAAEVLASAGVAVPDALALLRPLVRGTAANLGRALPERALSGPIVRGDAATVRAHLDALGEALPHLLPVYAALATETVRVAVRGGRLPDERAGVLLDLLHDALAARPAP